MSANQKPSSAGIGLRAPHVAEFQALRPIVPFLEVHSENHLCGGAMRAVLHDLRPDYPISMHCVGLSIGSAHGIDREHLMRIRALATEIDAYLISDHLSVSNLAGMYTNDLIPLPLVEETLALATGHVNLIQDTLGRQMLVENPSCYVGFSADEMDEGVFLSELARRTGCGILCDVNNIFVTAHNRKSTPLEVLSHFDPSAVKEIHIAGHATEEDENGPVLIDTHDRRACDEVLALYATATERFPDVPALVEWDSKLPELSVLLDEAARVQSYLMPEAVHAYA
ncbi:MAG: MNIO family bufferin maturase [Alphaproteobacteria bacterium]|jgi:uncharacterized protein (UPF0276 family)